MTTPFYHVDAFTDAPYSGNPAVVCPLDGPADETWMQAVAAEMNVSETAFFYPTDDGFNLRWFTPTVEMPLCGHATLASAHILRELGIVQVGESAGFQTASGLLTVALGNDLVHMDFPSVIAEPTEVPAALLDGLGTPVIQAGWCRLGYMAELENESAVCALTPDLVRLGELPGSVIYVTASAHRDSIDYVCRVFGPKVGIAEDPVTGGAQCTLGPYWAAKLGKDSLSGYQCSKRGGSYHVRVGDDRVIISGQAVTTSKGELLR